MAVTFDEAREKVYKLVLREGWSVAEFGPPYVREDGKEDERAWLVHVEPGNGIEIMDPYAYFVSKESGMIAKLPWIDVLDLMDSMKPCGIVRSSG